MSGIFYKGAFHENADLMCRQCKTPLYDSPKYDGIFLCFRCGGEFGIDGADETDGGDMPPVMVARHYGGVTINTALEYILEDDNETPRVFKNQIEAEAFLMSNGYSAEDLEHIYFVEADCPLLSAALKNGKISMADVSEELDYRDRSGGNKWNDFLYEYTTAELARLEQKGGGTGE